MGYSHGDSVRPHTPGPKIRIGICGPSGSGKTTMAKFIAEHLKIPFLESSAFAGITPKDEEVYTRLCKEPFKKNHQWVIGKSHQYPDFGYRFQVDLMKRREHLYQHNGNFVSDRTPLDVSVYTALQCGPYIERDLLAQLLEEGETLMFKHFTHIIFISNRLQLEFENDGVRVNNLLYQQAVVDPVFHEIVKHYVERHHLFPHLQMYHWNLDQRKKLILEFLGNTINNK